MLKIVVIGATSAIASATIRLYASRSAALFLVARDPEKLAAVASDARVRGSPVVHVRVLDLDNTAAHESLIAEVLTAFNRVDIALIAYGIQGDQHSGELDYVAASKIIQTNFLSVVSLITYFANDLERRQFGTLAVITSVAGDRGRKSNYIYGASKAALSVFLQGIRNRLHPSGVQVLTVKPGFVSSPMTSHLKQGFLFTNPHRIAAGIVSAIEGRRDVVYLPWFWRPIMWIIRAVPEAIFKRLAI